MLGVAEQIVKMSGARTFRGKGRLINYWLRHRPRHGRGLRTLPGGALIECDLSHDYDCMVYLRQEEEPDIRTLWKLLQPGQTFVDCGANIGLWSLVAASRVGPSGTILAFEPNAGTFLRLEKHFRQLNGLKDRAKLIASAVGAAIGTGWLAADGRHNEARMKRVADPSTTPVPVITIDEAVGDRTIHGIKIDIEGCGLDAMEGATRVLGAHKPWLCVEFNTAIAGANILGRWPVDQYLRDRGYAPSLFSDACSPSRPMLSTTWQANGYVNLLYTSTHLRT